MSIILISLTNMLIVGMLSPTTIMEILVFTSFNFKSSYLRRIRKNLLY